MASSTFNEKEFWAQFSRDIASARWQVIIQSPFIGSRRMDDLASSLNALLQRNVTVCLFVQEPNSRLDLAANYKMKELDMHVQVLRSLGAHITVKKDIHAKFAIIDGEILWQGSLNILSHVNTKEHMLRAQDKHQVKEIMQKYGLFTCVECKTLSLKYGPELDNPEYLKILGNLLAEYRRVHQLSRRALAAKCEITHRRISQIESGKAIRLLSLLKIFQHLDLRLTLFSNLQAPSAIKAVHERVNIQAELD